MPQAVHTAIVIALLQADTGVYKDIDAATCL
jgi:hypothetical protein